MSISAEVALILYKFVYLITSNLGQSHTIFFLKFVYKLCKLGKGNLNNYENILRKAEFN